MIGKKFNIYKRSKEHLIKSQEPYIPHFIWAVYAGVKLIYAGFSSIIHGVIPATFEGDAAYTVIDFYHKKLKNHVNPDYQKRIGKYDNNS